MPSCSSDNEQVIEQESDNIYISASLEDANETRVESGPVTSGKYWISFPVSSTKYVLGEVDFDNNNYKDENNRVPITEAGGNPFVIWDYIYNNANYLLYLDNVDPDYVDPDKNDPELLIFNNNNPFVAGKFGTTNEYGIENDLLWGSQEQIRSLSYIDFDLHHYMAGVRVVVTVDQPKDLGEAVVLTDGDLTLSSLIMKPYSYQRLTGAVNVDPDASEDDYETLELKKGTSNIEDEVEKNDLFWKSITTDVDGNTVYTSHDFILPPQKVREGQGRPKLTVTGKSYLTADDGTVLYEQEPKDVSYYGFIPHSMQTVNDGIVMNLSFLSDYILEIRTRITTEPPKLTFQIVYVYDWVDKGEFDLFGHQKPSNSDDTKIKE